MATAKQLAWRKKFAARYGGKKKKKKTIRRMKVRKQRVIKRAYKPKPVKGKRHMTGIFAGISKKGLLFYAASFLLSDGMTKVDSLRLNGFSPASQSEAFRQWKNNNLAGYVLTHYSMWKYGLCGIPQKIDPSIHVHNKALALQSFAYTYGDVPKYYNHFKISGVNGPSMKTAMNTIMKDDPLAAAAAGYSLYKYGAGISIDGVN